MNSIFSRQSPYETQSFSILQVIDPQGDNWAAGARDNGPMISKWDQLALAPELLRSLAKFG